MRRSRRDTGKEGINYRQSFDTSSLPSASNQNDDPDPLAPDFATRKLGLPLPVHPRPATGGPQSGPDDSSRRADSADIDIAVSEECRRPAQVVDNHHRPDLLRGSSRVLEKFSASCRRGEIESSLAGPTQAQLPFALVQVLQGCIMVRVYCRAAGRSGTLQPRRGRAKGLLPEKSTRFIFRGGDGIVLFHQERQKWAGKTPYRFLCIELSFLVIPVFHVVGLLGGKGGSKAGISRKGVILQLQYHNATRLIKASSTAVRSCGGNGLVQLRPAGNPHHFRARNNPHRCIG
ncbi:hypothetical protein PDE_07835 [Penicillium oxalicum 114-2]|uniref:Uncharacterized protein n=1 Tax=Penicillium oxalicum (strain 114-2 / CGMCC 5302) TaxID=933388 RepID=S7ZR60_PENO1|nr:hypothetical protein PDE_07835 [Penicillium oxalicum 114-2]